MLTLAHKLGRQMRLALLAVAGLKTRLALSVIAAAAAWLALFDLGQQARAIEAAQAERSQLGQAPAYRIELKPSAAREEDRSRPLLPASLVALIAAQARLAAFETPLELQVSNAQRDKTWPLDVLLVLDRSQTKPTPPGDFAPCYVLGHQTQGLDGAALLPVNRLWRCRPRPPGPALSKLNTLIGHPSLAIPLPEARELAPANWQSYVRVAYAGLPHGPDFLRPQATELAAKGWTLELRPLQLPSQASQQVLQSNRIWHWTALAMLLLAMLLYVLGAWPALRREAALRACLGYTPLKLGAWLATASASQALLLGLASFVLASLGQHWQTGEFGWRWHGPYAGVLLLGILGCAGLSAWWVASALAKPGRMAAWTR